MIILLVFGSFIFLLFRMIIRRGTSKELPLPPGPYVWPIIGNILQTRKNVYVHLAELAQVHGPLMSLHSGQRTLIIGSSSAVASEILKTHDDVLSGREVSRFQGKEPSIINNNLVFSSECDDGWRVIRNLYRSELFSGKALESRTKMRENKVEEMVKYLGSKEGEDVIIKDVLFVTVMNILSNTVFSTDLVDFEGNGMGACIMDTVKRLNMLAAKPKLSDIYPKLGRWDLQSWYKEVMHIIQDEFGSVWKDVLEMKRNGCNISSNIKDFTDSLIEKGINDLQMNLIMQELFSAGTETTSLSIEWFIAELMKNQEVMQKAKDEVTKQIDGNVVKESDLVRLPFLEACVKETLRLHPPGPLLLPHKATKRCEIMGHTIPKGSQILVNVWAISRDPKTWDDPLSFKPERFIGTNLSYKGKDFGYLPFGSGRRMCPGEAMASKTILLTVASLIRNFDWVLPNKMNPNEINMDEEFNMSMHMKEPLHVILKLREHLKD